MLNDVQHTTLGATDQGQVEGVVRVRGVVVEMAGRSFGFQRYEPEAVVIRGEDDLRHVPVQRAASNVPVVAIPVAVYIAARLIIRRRRRR